MLRQTVKLIGLISLLCIGFRPAWAGNKLMNVQGKLTDGSGTALTGTYVVTFRLYTSLAGSTTVWSDNLSVSVSTGLFNVTLGTSTSMDAVAFNTPYYLGLQVAGDANELSPRQLLGASAYALGSLGNFNAPSATITSISVSTISAVSSATITNATITNLNCASGGSIGDYVESIVSGNFPTSGQWGDAGSISLTQGDWDVNFNYIQFFQAATINSWNAGVSQTAGNSSTGLVEGSNYNSNIIPIATSVGSVPGLISAYRQQLSSTTPIYGKLKASYTGTAPTYEGRLSARRVHC